MANRHRFALKAAMVNYKGGECQLCGYKRCYRSLSFHHVQPGEKKFNLASQHNLAVEKIACELDKCVCLCRNCHDEVEEAIQWQNNFAILAKVQEIFAGWTPPADGFTFSRKQWARWHPGVMHKDGPTACTR